MVVLHFKLSDLVDQTDTIEEKGTGCCHHFKHLLFFESLRVATIREVKKQHKIQYASLYNLQKRHMENCILPGVQDLCMLNLDLMGKFSSKKKKKLEMGYTNLPDAPHPTYLCFKCFQRLNLVPYAPFHNEYD